MTGATIEMPQVVTVPRTHGDVGRIPQEASIGQFRDASQAWFWTPDWQAGEREASTELAEGCGQVFESAEEFLASLDD
jgi:hypothetical protein